MWLLILAYSAVISTILWYSKAENDIYNYKLLTAILWGSTIMVFIDHTYSYIKFNEPFIDLSIEAMLVGFAMLLLALMVWVLTILITDPKRVLKKQTKT